MTAIVIGHVVFSIYHSGRTVSPFSIRRTLKWLFNYGIEIGTHTVSVRSVVVVRIAVVVDIGEIGSGIRDCPFELVIRFAPTFDKVDLRLY